MNEELGVKNENLIENRLPNSAMSGVQSGDDVVKRTEKVLPGLRIRGRML